MPSRGDEAKSHVREGLRSRPAWLALGVGLGLTLGWAALSSERARDRAHLDFEDRSSLVASHVEASFRAPLEALYGIHALGAAWPDVDQRRFEQFAARLIERYPSLAALELFDVVKGEERADFERRISAQLGYPFGIREPSPIAAGEWVSSPPRERHVVLTRLTPFQRQLQGLDLTFEPLRRAQMAAAARAGAPIATEKFRLVEDPEGVFSVAVYSPLYRDGQVPADEGARERELRGFAVALYRLAPLMGAALAGAEIEQARVALLDRDPRLARDGALLFGSAEALAASDFEFRRDLRFAGRTWTFVSSREAPPRLLAATPSLLMGAFGSVLGAALLGVTTSLRASRRRTRALEELGPYTLLREVGSGGMGRVFEGQHRLLRRRAAIKVILQEQASAEQLRRFDLEAKITSRLCHPNTVVVFDYGRTRRGDFYYAMEYVDGITWEELVQRYGAQPAARVRQLLVQACGSLAEAHGLGLVHRDLKPSNLMLAQVGGVFDFVKVLDFGLVRVTRGVEAGMSGSSGLLGTPRYMAPESFASSRADPRSDVYSLGCVAYFLLSGQPPFSAKSDAAMATLHLTRMPPALRGRGKAGLTPELERVVMRCLAKNPEERFGSAAALMRALSELSLPPWTQADAAAFWAEHGHRMGAQSQP